MRLIDADVLKEKLYIESDNFNPVVTEKEIDETPTIEAKPVVHGEWIYGWNCSECGCSYMDYADGDSGRDYDYPLPNFCPNCGADMRKLEPPELIVPMDKMKEFLEKAGVKNE